MIYESFENISAYSERGNKTLKVNNALIYMICKDNQPFTIVENDSFRNLMKVTASHYKLPSKTTLSAVFRNELESVENITLTTDIWTETMSIRNFLGITGHFGICTEFFLVPSVYTNHLNGKLRMILLRCFWILVLNVTLTLIKFRLYWRITPHLWLRRSTFRWKKTYTVFCAHFKFSSIKCDTTLSRITTSNK